MPSRHLDNNETQTQTTVGFNTSRVMKNTVMSAYQKCDSMRIRHKDGKPKGSKASNVSLMLRKTRYQYKNMNSSWSGSGQLLSNRHADNGARGNQSLYTSMRRNLQLQAATSSSPKLARPDRVSDPSKYNTDLLLDRRCRNKVMSMGYQTHAVENRKATEVVDKSFVNYESCREESASQMSFIHRRFVQNVVNQYHSKPLMENNVYIN